MLLGTFGPVPTPPVEIPSSPGFPTGLQLDANPPPILFVPAAGTTVTDAATVQILTIGLISDNFNTFTSLSGDARNPRREVTP